MPVKEVRKDRKIIGYKWDKSGKVYKISEYGKKRAKEKAIKQGVAIKSSGYKG